MHTPYSTLSLNSSIEEKLDLYLSWPLKEPLDQRALRVRWWGLRSAEFIRHGMVVPKLSGEAKTSRQRSFSNAMPTHSWPIIPGVLVRGPSARFNGKAEHRQKCSPRIGMRVRDPTKYGER